MRNIPLTIIAIILLSMILSSCSERARAKRLVRQAFNKIEKARTLDPSVIDSIKGTKIIMAETKESSGERNVDSDLDTTAFNKAISDYDSLKDIADKLKSRHDEILNSNSDLAGYAIDLETKQDSIAKVNKALEVINIALSKSRNRLMQGYAKDSTYIYEDSVIKITARVEAGLLRKISFEKRSEKVEVKVDTNEIKLITTVPVWRQTYFWVLIAVIVFLLLVIVVSWRRNS